MSFVEAELEVDVGLANGESGAEARKVPMNTRDSVEGDGGLSSMPTVGHNSRR